jgi:hypothetical protein
VNPSRQGGGLSREADPRPTTCVAGTVHQFVAIEVGRPFVARDGDLDNDVYIDDSWALLKDAGSHPGFYIDFCAEMEDYFLG